MRAEPRRDEVVELLGGAANGEHFVRRVDDGAVLRVSRDVARNLEPRPIALRARILFALDNAPVTSLATHCGGLAQELVHDGDLFEPSW